jgi:hypothetical protein
MAKKNEIREMNGFQVGEIVRGPVVGVFKIVEFAEMAGEMRAMLRLAAIVNGEVIVSRAKSALLPSELRKLA